MAGANAAIGDVLSQRLLEAAKVVEEQVDAQLQELDNLDDDDYEAIRQKRLEAMKKMGAKRDEWIQNGHGQYSELPDEKAFFDATKKSRRVIVHFYRDETFRCKIVDKHFEILANKHMETRFLKINAEKAHFLTQRLKVTTLPTILFIKDEKTMGRMVGFTQLGDTDEFTTETLEWRLGTYDIITYSGDLSKPPGSILLKLGVHCGHVTPVNCDDKKCHNSSRSVLRLQVFICEKLSFLVLFKNGF